MMTRETARWIVHTVLLGIVWGVLSAVLGVSFGWWLMGLLFIEVIMLASSRIQKRRATRGPRRPGPRAEWID